MVIVNGRLSEESVRRHGGPFFPLERVREAVSFVACRAESDLRGFERLGFDSGLLAVTGSTKFDVLPEAPRGGEREALRSELGIERGVPVVVFGSVRPAEERAVVNVTAAVLSGGAAHVIIAPRHLARVTSIERGLSSVGAPYALRSSPAADPRRVTILDTTGELRAVYALADVAFVGGTLGSYGGHNPLEPAAMGVPVLLGPDTRSCAYEAELLVERGGAARVADAEGLMRAALELLRDSEKRRDMGDRAAGAVSSGRGATERTMTILTEQGVLPRAGAVES